MIATGQYTYPIDLCICYYTLLQNSRQILLLPLTRLKFVSDSCLSSACNQVLVICFVLCTLNYGSMAILGYLMYGDDVKSQVTLNLPEGKIGSKLAIYTTLINPFSKYALMVTPLATAVEERLQLAGGGSGSGSGRRSSKRSVNVLVRTLLVVSTVVVALAVPFFGHLMALVGSLLSVMAAMLLPCIFYLKIFGVARCSRAEVALIATIIVLGSVVAAAGTYASVKKIVLDY